MIRVLAESRPTRSGSAGRRFTISLFATYLLLLGAVVLFKLPYYRGIPQSDRIINLMPFVGSFDGFGYWVRREIFSNVLVFVPLGVFVSLLTRWRLAQRVLLFVGASLTLEVIQFGFAIGIADVTDLINNTLGGIIGCGLHRLTSAVLNRRTAAVINAVAAVLTVLVLWQFGQILWASSALEGMAPG